MGTEKEGGDLKLCALQEQQQGNIALVKKKQHWNRPGSSSLNVLIKHLKKPGFFIAHYLCQGKYTALVVSKYEMAYSPLLSMGKGVGACHEVSDSS